MAKEELKNEKIRGVLGVISDYNTYRKLLLPTIEKYVHYSAAKIIILDYPSSRDKIAWELNFSGELIHPDKKTGFLINYLRLIYFATRKEYDTALCTILNLKTKNFFLFLSLQLISSLKSRYWVKNWDYWIEKTRIYPLNPVSFFYCMCNPFSRAVLNFFRRKFKMFFLRLIFLIISFFSLLPKSKKQRAILISLGAHSKVVGEFILFTSIFKKLKILYPDCYIIAEIYPNHKKLTGCIPFVDKWITLTHKAPRISLREIFIFSRFNFINVFLFFVWDKHYSFASCLHKRNTRFIVEQFVNKESHYEFFDRLSNYRYLDKLFTSDKQISLPELVIPQKSQEEMNKILDEFGIKVNRPIVIISPGASKPIKQWDKEKFVQVGRDLNRHVSNLQIIISGTQDEKELAAFITAQISGNAIDLAGSLKLDEFAAFVKLSDLLIGNDSGAAHVARAVSTPCIVIYGPTESATIPAQSEDFIPLTKADKLRCYPCYYDCFKDHSECLELVSADDVAEAALTILNRNGKGKYFE